MQLQILLSLLQFFIFQYFVTSLQLRPAVRCNSRFQTTSKSKLVLKSFYRNDDGGGVPLKSLIFVGIGAIGIFGFGLFGSLQEAVVSTTAPSVVTTSSGEARGARTRLTTKEINEKLANIPVFYINNGQGGIYVNNDNVGLVFTDIGDAEAYQKTEAIDSTLKISATTLDTIYLPLIEKKQKIGSYMEAVVSKSQPEAKYLIQPSSAQIKNLPEDWSTLRSPNDVPLFRVNKLAFSKDESVVVPLFLRKEDAIESENRRRELAKEKNDIEPVVQVTALADIIAIFRKGGFESRLIEFFPAVDSINKINELIN